MQSLWRQHGLTIVMVTHDLSEAFTLATRIIAFERAKSRPEELTRYGASISRDLEIFPPRSADDDALRRRGFVPRIIAASGIDVT